MFLCAERLFWKENVYERGIWRAEICNEKVCSLSLFFSIHFSFSNLHSSSLNWFIELYALFCFGRQPYTCFVDQSPMFLAQLHNRRKLLRVALGKGICFHLLLCFFPISIGCLLMGFILAYLGSFLELAGIMIYTGCFSCQMDFQMVLNWLTMSKDRYWNILVLVIGSCYGGCSADVVFYSCLLQKILGGYKQGNGIVCECCDREVWSLSCIDRIKFWNLHCMLVYLFLLASLYCLTILSLVPVNRLVLHSLKHMLEWLPGVNRE